ncbi:sphingomyelin synthase family protein [bacterium BMS3Abin03]|nr:sphingomyelin synthase family protein [bacterium BMS3Abin03]
MKWQDFIAQKKSEIIFTIVLVALVLFFLPKFLNFVELRDGVILPDPILKLFTPVNLTWLTFALIYVSLISAIIYFSTKPDLLFTALQSYAILIIIRMVVMFVTPFNPPADSIILNDPFVQLFGSGEILTKDLFFSGHTATLFLLYLIADKKYLKFTYLIFTIIVGLAVLLQHVHYTIDVIAAPFFSYTSFRLVKIFKNKIIKAIK